jgi:hypothetical protein
MSTVTFRIWRGESVSRRQARRLHDRSFRGHGRARRRPQDPGHAGQRPRLPLELQGRQVRLLLGEINGMPRLMCMTRLDMIPIDKPVTIEPMRAFPEHPRPGHRRLVEFPRQKEDQAVQAARARRAGRHLAHAAGGHRPRAGIPQVHRVLPLPGRLPRFARPQQARRIHRPALPGLHRRAGNAPARHRGPHCRS